MFPRGWKKTSLQWFFETNNNKKKGSLESVQPWSFRWDSKRKDCHCLTQKENQKSLELYCHKKKILQVLKKCLACKQAITKILSKFTEAVWNVALSPCARCDHKEARSVIMDGKSWCQTQNEQGDVSADGCTELVWKLLLPTHKLIRASGNTFMGCFKLHSWKMTTSVHLTSL